MNIIYRRWVCDSVI